MASQPTSSTYDIVIVGAGPVGLMLSSLLARWGYNIKHIDNRAEPTPTGRADGIQPRSLDLLRNMGLKTAIMAHKPARVYEVAFWDEATKDVKTPAPISSSTGKHGIVRTGTWASCPSFIDARYPFTTLLHQGLIERVFIADIERSGSTIQRPWTITDFTSGGEADTSEYPVEVQLKQVDGTATETVRAKYLFSGEGARSSVRQKLGIPVTYKDPISYVWGVMDGVVDTDFPDIRMKCTIHSKDGSIMVIPREAGMVRLYIQIASSDDPDWNPRKTATAEEVQAVAKKIFEPYHITWESVDWFSVYPIGQGISDRYTLDHRVFLGGDACHTHSPKAGQGMNTAFLDAQNLAWKIHLVEQGFASREILHTYEPERKEVAERLLAFDNKYAKLFSQKPMADVQAAANSSTVASNSAAPAATAHENEFIHTFKESCEFTSGYGVFYQPSALVWSPKHPAQSSVIIGPDACHLRPGRLLVNANVTRVEDANVLHLEQQVPMNGAFRLFIFGGKPSPAGPTQALVDLERGLRQKTSFYSSYLWPEATEAATAAAAKKSETRRDCPHSPFFSICLILAAQRSAIEISRDAPGLLADYHSHIYADDRWDRRVPDAPAPAHAKMGLDPESGAVVVVRPDGYVGVVVRLVEGSATIDALNDYFGSFCTKKFSHAPAQL